MTARSFGAYVVALSVLLVVGRLAVQFDSGLSLFWPAAGVSTAWLLRTTGRRNVLVAASAIFTVFTLGNVITGASWPVGLLLGTANTVLAVVTRLTAGALRPQFGASRLSAWIAPLPRLRTSRDFGRLLVAVAVGALASSVIGSAAIYLRTGDVTGLRLAGWIVRYGVGALAVAGPILASRADPPTRRPTLGRLVELALLGLFTLTVLWAVFGPDLHLPLAFLPLMLVAWAGLRLSPRLAGSYGLLLGGLTLILTWLIGGGPFAAADDPLSRAIVVQAFAGLAVGLSLLLSLSVAERDRLAAGLRGSEERAREQAAELRAITQTVPDGLLVVDREGRTVLRNPPAERLLEAAQVDPARPFGRPSPNVRSLDGAPVEPSAHPVARALAGETVSGRLLVLGAAGDTGRIYSVDAAPLPGAGDRRSGRAQAVVVFRDVTAEHEHLERLEGFAGIVAHDLKNPVGIIHGWAETLGEDLEDLGVAEDSPAGQSLARIELGARRAQVLINDLLAYSTTRTTTMQVAPIDLDRLIAELTDELRHASPERDIVVEHRHLDRVEGDPVMIRQLFANLLGNAVKYTDADRSPRIEVASRLEQGRVAISVSDNGIGIQPSHRERVFEAFHRAPTSVSYPGTGLGLAICAQTVARHGGRISVSDNDDGPGSRFDFTLPAAAGEPSVTAGPAAERYGPVPVDVSN